MAHPLQPTKTVLELPPIAQARGLDTRARNPQGYVPYLVAVTTIGSGPTTGNIVGGYPAAARLSC